MPLAQTNPTPQAAPPALKPDLSGTRSASIAHEVGWVCGSELGKSDRHVRRLAKTMQPLGAARKRGRTWYFYKAHPDIAAMLKQARADRSYEDLSAYTHKQVEAARLKVKIVERSRHEIAQYMRTADVGRTVAVEWFCKDRAPELEFGVLKVNTFRRWEKTYDQAGDYKVKSMIDNRGREPGDRKCSEDAWEFFLSIYLDDRKRSVRLCYDLTHVESAKRGWDWPSYRSIVRRVDRDVPNITNIYFRESKKKFESDCAPRVRRTYDHVAAGDEWCGDENSMDLYAQVPDGRGGFKQGRPKLTAWLDVRSRMFVGWHISAKANSDTIIAAAKMGIREFGPPRKVTCDNGSDYKAAASIKKKSRRKGRKKKWDSFHQEHFAGVWTELGCEYIEAIPYSPQSKMIESHFRAVCNDFCKLFESYCGNKPENRPDIAGKFRVDELPTIEELNDRFTAWLEAHHCKPREGEAMYGLSPNQAMEQFRSKMPRQALSGDQLDYICSRFVGPVKVTKNGVRYNGQRYGEGETELYRLQGEEVWLRIEPDRADIVHVVDLKKRPIVTVKNDRLTGVNPDDIREGNKWRKKAREVARESVKLAPLSYRHSAESAAIEAMHQRYKSQQTETPPPEPPTAIEAVRPDLQADLKRVADEEAAMQCDVRESASIDFAEARRRMSDQAHADPVELEDEVEDFEVEPAHDDAMGLDPVAIADCMDESEDESSEGGAINAFEMIKRHHDRLRA